MMTAAQSVLNSLGTTRPGQRVVALGRFTPLALAAGVDTPVMPTDVMGTIGEPFGAFDGTDWKLTESGIFLITAAVGVQTPANLAISCGFSFSVSLNTVVAYGGISTCAHVIGQAGDALNCAITSGVNNTAENMAFYIERMAPLFITLP